MLYDLESQVPAFFHISTASVYDSKAMKEISYESGSYYVFDRRNFPDSEELSMLESVEDIQLALFGTDDDDNYHGDEHIVFIEDEYPAVLLDEIYAKLKESE